MALVRMDGSLFLIESGKESKRAAPYLGIRYALNVIQIKMGKVVL